MANMDVWKNIVAQFIFILAILSNEITLGNILKSTSSPALNPSRPLFFTNAFANAVKNSTQLIQLFDINVPQYLAREFLFQTYRDSLKKTGLDHAESLSKELSDALYQTFPFMSQDYYIYSVSGAMSLYLISQNILTPDNAALYGKAFSDYLLINFPKDNEMVNYLTLFRCLSNGIIDFLASLGDSAACRYSVFTINCAANFFAATHIIKPSIEISIIAIPGMIPSAYHAHGLDTFSSAFLNTVNLSPTLQDLFYVNEPASTVSKAWKSAVYSFCISISCYYPNAYTVGESVLRTYDHMTKITYVKCIANGYGLMLLGIGNLSSLTALERAKTLGNTIELFVKAENSKDNLETKIGAVLKAFKYLVESQNVNIINQLATLTGYIETQFYAESDVKRPTLI